MILRFLLFPISFLYGSIIAFRNILFNNKILPSKGFDLPIISVGNLSTGGTGKSPQIEYLIRLLSATYKVATLSRGYGRKTKGFLLANKRSSSADIGDEPLQFFSKYDSIKVAVDEKRVRGVELLQKKVPETEVILLDDAFQHRSISPGLSILLTDFSELYTDDYMLPTGNLREFKRGAKRADIIVVTKCPNLPFEIERERLIKKIAPLPHQQVFFSIINYGNFTPLDKQKSNMLSKEYYFENNYSILLLSGIANITPLTDYLKSKTKNVIPMNYKDHHEFSETELRDVESRFNDIQNMNKIILTTEKDAMRLRSSKFIAKLSTLPVFFIPIETVLNEKDTNDLNQTILDYVKKTN